MTFARLFVLAIAGLGMVACAGFSPMRGNVPSDVNVFQAQDIDNRQIQFVWMELPSQLHLGSNEIRVFMARMHPPGMLVPTETELPCIIQSDNEYLDLRPEPLLFEFDGRQLVGSYAWKACATCVDCYMDWETTMEIVATMTDEQIDVSIGIRHMGHNVQDDYLRIELRRQELNSKEPRILCRRSFDCREMEFAPRP